MEIKAAGTVRKGDWVIPLGHEWPAEVLRVTACTPLDLYGDGTRMVNRRLHFAMQVDEYGVDSLVATY